MVLQVADDWYRSSRSREPSSSLASNVLKAPPSIVYIGNRVSLYSNYIHATLFPFENSLNVYFGRERERERERGRQVTFESRGNPAVSPSAIIVSTAGWGRRRVYFASREGNRFQYQGSRVKLNRNEKYRNDRGRPPRVCRDLRNATLDVHAFVRQRWRSSSLYAERVLLWFSRFLSSGSSLWDFKTLISTWSVPEDNATMELSAGGAGGCGQKSGEIMISRRSGRATR